MSKGVTRERAAELLMGDCTISPGLPEQSHGTQEDFIKYLLDESSESTEAYAKALLNPKGAPCHPADYEAKPDPDQALPPYNPAALGPQACPIEDGDPRVQSIHVDVPTSDTEVEVDFDKIGSFVMKNDDPQLCKSIKWEHQYAVCPAEAAAPNAAIPPSDNCCSVGSLVADVKDSNPKDAIGIRKVPYSTLPTPVLAECGVAMLEGAIKYGRHNYRVIGVRASVYYDAVVARHLGSWWEGEDTDEESGISHLSKAIAGLMVLRDAQIRGKMVDDRPVGTKGFIKELNKKVAEMMDRLPEPLPAYVANGQPQDEYRS